ncbi:AAA family ATPase [Polymorphospora rubra]|uniref:MinD/ParA family ATP-binding protein n=1 Tax=Polymorphospora rubra TaxID=338584 RepID=UPI003F4D45F3
MEGTEAGWGRPAEPAPRWRALLDRALLGGRTGEQPELGERRGGSRRAEEPASRPATNGYRGTAAGPGHADPGYSGRYPADPGPADFSRYEPADPGPAGSARVEPRYGSADPLSDPLPDRSESRYEFGERSDLGYDPGARYEPEPRFRPDPGYDPGTRGRGESTYQPEPRHRPEPEPAAESRWSLLDNGYRARLDPPDPPRGSAQVERPWTEPRDDRPWTEPQPPARADAPWAEPRAETRAEEPWTPRSQSWTEPAAPSWTEPRSQSWTEPAAPARSEPVARSSWTEPAGESWTEPRTQPRAQAPVRSRAEVPGRARVEAPWTEPAAPGRAEVPWTEPAAPGRAEVSWTEPPQPSWAEPLQAARPEPTRSGVGSARVPAARAEARVAPGALQWQANAVDAEVSRAASVLRRDMGTPRVVAFANPKGGVHKTTATVLAAATVGSVRGRGVLAWDDNELRGTLGLRAGSARHARTIRHLIDDLPEIEGRHGIELTDWLDDYLRHASDGSYDVLAGEENSRFAQQLDQATVQRVLELLRRTHDVICVDTGNNVESANWRTVLQAADQLVVTTVPREDAAFTADWMLDLLHDVGMGELAANAVTLLSCPNPEKSPMLDDFARHFATRTRAVAIVPYDPALETGSSIEYGQLQPDTRDAWLRAASVMLEPFAR